MELYVLDSLLRRETVIDRFESLIWTERFKDYGDFELLIESTLETRQLLVTDTKLAMNESYRVMIIETVEGRSDADGKRLLKISGRSLESILESRVARGKMEDLTTTPKWIITDTPAKIARKVFKDICVTGILTPVNGEDKIPFIREGTILPPSTIPEPIDPITKEYDPITVGAAIKELCDVWGMGFALLRNFDASELWFSVYTGNDRTTGQAKYPAVVFSQELDNLQNTTELTTIEKAYNVAYVFSPAGFLVVYPQDVDPMVSGFDRHVLVVNATDITDETPDPMAAMLQKGREELALNNAYQAFDGEINRHSSYKYGVDYHLGDLVEMRNIDGDANQMRVTEQIFVSDQEGERSYPTLTVNVFINTGSWLSWEQTKRWIDFEDDTTTVWANV